VTTTTIGNDAALVRTLVGHLRAELGRGPTWRELIDAAGSGAEGPARVRALIFDGQLQPGDLSWIDRTGRYVPCRTVAPCSATEMRARREARTRVPTGEEARKVKELVGRFRAAKGRGPTWAGLSRAMGWDRDTGRRLIYALSKAGALDLTQLTPDPDYVPAWVRSFEPDAEDRRAVSFVAAYRQAKGCGPTWREVGEAVGWWTDDVPTWQARYRAQGRVRRLVTARYLAATDEARSLTVGPAGAGVLAPPSRRAS
jgi:hypothetical protein